jgi:hypothetical protein
MAFETNERMGRSRISDIFVIEAVHPYAGDLLTFQGCLIRESARREPDCLGPIPCRHAGFARKSEDAPILHRDIAR